MKKEIIVVFGIILIIVIALSIDVRAVGNAEGGNRNNNNTIQNDSDIGQTQEIDCETSNNTKQRIRCRLIQGTENLPDSIPEACRNESIRGRCVAFYSTVRTCYKLDGRAKDACFRRASGLTKKFSEEAQEGRKEKVRNYMVALLYDLEERVEKAYGEGKIDADESAALVEKIVNIKKAILEGGNKEDIRTMLQELKQMWRLSVSEVENG